LSLEIHNQVFRAQLNKAQGLGDLSVGSWILFAIAGGPAFLIGQQFHMLVGLIMLAVTFMGVHFLKRMDSGRHDFVEIWIRRKFKRPVYSQVERDEKYERFETR
jgi:hypothetical protein